MKLFHLKKLQFNQRLNWLKNKLSSLVVGDASITFELLSVWVSNKIRLHSIRSSEWKKRKQKRFWRTCCGDCKANKRRLNWSSDKWIESPHTLKRDILSRVFVTIFRVHYDKNGSREDSFILHPQSAGNAQSRYEKFYGSAMMINNCWFCRWLAQSLLSRNLFRWLKINFVSCWRETDQCSTEMLLMLREIFLMKIFINDNDAIVSLFNVKLFEQIGKTSKLSATSWGVSSRWFLNIYNFTLFDDDSVGLWWSLYRHRSRLIS